MSQPIRMDTAKQTRAELHQPTISSPSKKKASDVIYGKVSMKTVTEMSALTPELGNVLIEGVVFGVDHKELRSHNTVIRFDVTDYTSSIRVSQFMRTDEAKPIIKGVKTGQTLLIQGRLEMDRYDGDLVLRPTGITMAEPHIRKDTAAQKRVELHLHTKMSAMDALTDVGQVIERAVRWGHKAIAITDHGVIHAFPDAEKAAAGKIKVIYGAEAYMPSEENGRKEPYHTTILVQSSVGLKNLYRLISASHLNCFSRRPLMPRDLIDRHREGLLLGSGCWEGELFQAILGGKPREELERIASWYDYLEIQPLSNNAFLLRPDEEGRQIAQSEEDLRDFNRKVVELGEKLGKPVCATGDVHFLEPHEEIYRDILLASKNVDTADSPNPLYFRTTDEMLEEFSYLGEEKAWEVVVDNTNLVADRIQTFPLLPEGLRLPGLEGAQTLPETVRASAHALYGDVLPAVVEERLGAELEIIATNGYDVIFEATRQVVNDSVTHGYPVSFRGGVGSSLVAFLAGITQVNPLPAHYRCPRCRHSDFSPTVSAGCGADLPDAVCPNCGAPYQKDGFRIPFESFFGLGGEKIPDIDLNVAEEYLPLATGKIRELFGAERVFRAGTIGTVGEKTAYSYVCKYARTRGLDLPEEEKKRLSAGCVGVKRTTGQYPGSLVIVPQDMDICDFTPVQHPANDTDTETMTTHLDYPALARSLYKLDVLRHDFPAMLHMLQNLTGVDPMTIPLDDPDTMSLFTSSKKLGFVDDPVLGPTGTVAIPEFNTKYTRQMLIETQPKNFNTLVHISGFSHGTGVWLGNARDLIVSGTATINSTVGCRDDIMLYLMEMGLEPKMSFEIMEAVQKGKVKEGGFNPGWEKAMREHKVPDWYISSLAKIGYLFPRAHAVAYVMMAFRIAWFKVHRPLAFYATYFTIRARAFDATVMCLGMEQVKGKMQEIVDKDEDASAWEQDMLATLEVCYEFYLRGYQFESIDLYRSDATKFLVDEEKGTLLPPFISVPGLGEFAAQSIVEQCRGRTFRSISEFSAACPEVSKAHIEDLKTAGAFEEMPEA